MRGSTFVRIALVAALLLAASVARATTMLPMSLEDLVDRSDVIAHVRVGAVHVEQRSESPFRVTDLTVLESYQGAQSGDVLRIWQRGDGNIFVIGDPMLEPGEEGLVFLRRVDGRYYLTALAQSFWWIREQSGALIAERDIRQVTLVPLGEPRSLPPNRVSWSRLREMVLDVCMGVQP